MEDLLSMITSSFSIINDVGEGSRYFNPLCVTPPSLLLRDDPITKLGTQTKSPPNIVDLVPALTLIYLVIYGYKQPDLIGVTTLPNLQGTRLASKLACLLFISPRIYPLRPASLPKTNTQLNHIAEQRLNSSKRPTTTSRKCAPH
jgi:hypothetical protein